jgi:hypothetical protein
MLSRMLLPTFPPSKVWVDAIEKAEAILRRIEERAAPR